MEYSFLQAFQKILRLFATRTCFAFFTGAGTFFVIPVSFAISLIIFFQASFIDFFMDEIRKKIGN